MKIKDMKKVKIINYTDFSRWGITENELREYINNLTLNDIQIDEYNTFKFTKYNEYVEVFIYYNGFGDLICNIVDIYRMAVNNTADSTVQVINRFEWNPPLYFLIVMNGITINTPLTGIPIIVAMITDINNGDISNTKLFNAY